MPTTDETGTYTLTPLGLLSMELGHETAQRVIDRLELYLRRHCGVPSAIVLDEDGAFKFSPIARAPGDDDGKH